MAGSKYVDSPSAVQVIGCIMRQPSLMDYDGRYFFNEDDFPNEFHKVVFGAVFNLHQMGATGITIRTVEDYLSSRPQSLAIYKTGKGSEWLKNVANSADVANFEYYYSRVKKMTLLREYDNIGLDVSWIYDPDNLFDIKRKQQQENYLDNLSLTDMANLIEDRIDNIRRTYIDNSTDDAIHAGDGILELIEELQQEPEMGVPLYGSYVNTAVRGMRLGKFYLRSAATGVGKALPNSTIIPTPDGDKQVKDIRVGDYLFDAFGQPTKVLGIYPQGSKPVWQISFKDGRQALCCEEHLWSYCKEGQKKKSKLQRKFYTKTLKEIVETESLYKPGHGYIVQVPMQKAVNYTEKEYFIKPYVFGLLLGDGSFRYSVDQKALSYSSENEELPSIIAQEMNWNYKKVSNYNYDWHFEWKEDKKHKNVWVEEVLFHYPELQNVRSEEKFIPQEYFYGSISQRFDILNGLLDSDGSIDKEKGRISYWTVSPYLRDGVCRLAFSLGFKATWVEDNHKNSLPLYKVEIAGTPEDKIKLFRLKRKKELVEQWFNNGKRKELNLFNPIVDIQQLDYSEEMTCFYVDNDEHLFLMNDYIVTHNTRTMVADACNCACDKIWRNGQWENNGYKNASLFITTELELNEIQTMCLAFLADIDEEHILVGDYDFGEKERVIEAAKILAESPLYIEEIPDFNLRDIENIIKRNIRMHGCKYIFYDYIHTSMKILEEISQRSGGVRLREDNILFLLSVKLKDICNQFGVFILSSTQLNQDWKSSDIPDQNLLRGAKSMADKIDVGMILLDATDDDKEALGEKCKAEGFAIPNVKLSIYKNRRGSYNKCYLWIAANKATCRFEPIFCTDYKYELIPIANRPFNYNTREVFN